MFSEIKEILAQVVRRSEIRKPHNSLQIRKKYNKQK